MLNNFNYRINIIVHLLPLHLQCLPGQGTGTKNAIHVYTSVATKKMYKKLIGIRVAKSENTLSRSYDVNAVVTI